MRLYRTEKNSGGGGYVARNMGLNFAGGKYVYFVDADDFILLTALETLYNAAEEHKAEVITMGARYRFSSLDDIRKELDVEGRTLLKERKEDKIVLKIDALNDNLQKLPFSGNFSAAWTKFIRRDFLIKNEISFPEIALSADFAWIINLYCHAKRLLRLPIPLYFWREHDKSITNQKKSPREEISFRVSKFVDFLKALNDLSNRNEILRQNPTHCYRFLLSDFNYRLECLSKELEHLSSQDVYETLLHEFKSRDLPVPFFFSQIVNRDKRLLKVQDPIIEPTKEGKQDKFSIGGLSSDENRQDKISISGLSSGCDDELRPENSTNPRQKQSPAVSVIIPMYNVEKYIGELLDSILFQTFQDFEVIVVDDCSTDSSYAVVESYLPKFEGRLKLAKMEKNSGGETAPRNRGFDLARGEYVIFVDSDDFILLTALEILYTAATENNADVVYSSAYYRMDKLNEVRKYLDSTGYALQRKGIEETLTLRGDDPVENLSQLMFNEAHGMHSKFVRREFLLENDITFPLNLPIAGDFIWVINVYCHAKRFLRIPNAFYFYRHYHDSSITTTKREPSAQIFHWVSSFVTWIETFNDLVKRTEILDENPVYCYKVLYDHFSWSLRCISEELGDLQGEQVYEILYRKYAEESGSTDFMVPFFFSQIVSREKPDTKPTLIFDAAIQLMKLVETAKVPQKIKYPAVSVIIPMYNREKYIGECLDSLLIQTFQDFEIIVVDDGSTDNGVSIVEKYKKKFGERLRISKMKKNSGNCGEPRNKGISLSRSEYIYCLDSDDTLVRTALEEMYTLAKEYEADVVYCEKYFMSKGTGKEYVDNIHPADSRIQRPPFVNKPTMETTDLAERLKKFMNVNYWMSACLRLVKRDFLVENDITFSPVLGEDNIWSVEILFRAKRFLRIPNACFVRRIHKDGISFGEYTTPDFVKRWLDLTIHTLKDLDNFMKEIEFFRKNPASRYKILESLMRSGFSSVFGRVTKENFFNICSIIQDKFGGFLGEHNILVSCLCAHIISLMNQNARINNQIVCRRKFMNYLTARMDIKFTSQTKSSAFQILSVSDNGAIVKQPEWLQKNGVGYQIQSYVGELKFVAKATASGEIRLDLRGIDVRTEDKSTRIPYWIDYTKLTVNGKMIFDKLTPAWHDKLYRHRMNAKAGEEIAIEVEWLPHRSDN